MDNQERAKRTLKFRESAAAGRWISRGTKIRLVILAFAIAAILWGAYIEPEPWTIGAAGFFSGIAFASVRGVLASRRVARDAWPFTELVTDWDKVNEIAGIQPGNSPTLNPDDTLESN
jgi:hypothetical protein